jgi:hypothetical protein
MTGMKGMMDGDMSRMCMNTMNKKKGGMDMGMKNMHKGKNKDNHPKMK